MLILYKSRRLNQWLLFTYHLPYVVRYHVFRTNQGVTSTLICVWGVRQGVTVTTEVACNFDEMNPTFLSDNSHRLKDICKCGLAGQFQKQDYIVFSTTNGQHQSGKDNYSFKTVQTLEWLLLLTCKSFLKPYRVCSTRHRFLWLTNVCLLVRDVQIQKSLILSTTPLCLMPDSFFPHSLVFSSPYLSMLHRLKQSFQYGTRPDFTNEDHTTTPFLPHAYVLKV